MLAAMRKKQAAKGGVSKSLRSKIPSQRPTASDGSAKVTGRKRSSTPVVSASDAANDSDTVSDDVHADRRPQVFSKSLKKARRDTPVLKKLREAQLMDKPTALYSDVLDRKADAQSVHTEDFEFGEDQTFVAPNNGSSSAAAAAAAAAVPKAQIGEELAAVAVQAKREMGVQSGKAERELTKRAIKQYEDKHECRAEFEEQREIRREMRKIKEVEDKLDRKQKWKENLDDTMIEQVNANNEVGHNMKKVRARVQSTDPRKAKLRMSAVERLRLKMQEKEKREQLEQEEKFGEDVREEVADTQVRVSPSGEAESAQATTPAPGTEQRKAIEAQLKKLDDEGIFMSPDNREAKLATGVPPGVVVQGRELTAAADDNNELQPMRPQPLGAVIHGDGSTLKTAKEYAMQVLVSKSSSQENLTNVAIENVFSMLREAVKIFYMSYEVLPQDSEFNKHDVEYAKAFEKDLHDWIDQFFPEDGKRRVTLREFLKTLYIGEKPSERAKKLKAKLSVPRESEEETALIDAILLGSTAVAKGQRDVQEAMKETALEWQTEAQIESLKKHVPDISDAELAAQLSSATDADEHVLLSRIRNYTAQDVMFRDIEEAPISLQRENEVIYGEHEKSVWYEAMRQNESCNGSSNFVNLLRMEMTRNLKKKRARLDELHDEASKRVLSHEETDEIKELNRTLIEAEASRRAKESRAIVQHYGHPDAAPAVEALFKRTAMELETVSRSYAADFLREPLPDYGERPCASDKFCICNTHANSLRYSNDCDRTSGGFVAREFLLPSKDAVFRETGKLPAMRQRCYACHLHNTAIEFDKLKSQKNHSGERLICIQPFKTIFEKPGEYSAAVCNLSSVLNHRCYGIFAPFPRFQSNFYQYTVVRITDSKANKHYDLRALEEMPSAVFH